MKNVPASKILALTVLAFSTLHCSDSDDGNGGSGGAGGGGSCVDVSGTWAVSGDCPGATGNCTITQSGCNAAFNCDFGTATGTVSGNSITFGVQGTPCTGTVANQQFSASCSTSGGSCSANATCTSGACGSGSGGSGGGSGGSGGGSGGSGGSGGDVLAQKCSQMCSHLLAPPLSGCGKVFDTPAKCESECYEHVTPQGGNPPEATESELDCGISAPDCDTWLNCGDLT